MAFPSNPSANQVHIQSGNRYSFLNSTWSRNPNNRKWNQPWGQVGNYTINWNMNNRQNQWIDVGFASFTAWPGRKYLLYDANRMTKVDDQTGGHWKMRIIVRNANGAEKYNKLLVDADTDIYNVTNMGPFPMKGFYIHPTNADVETLQFAARLLIHVRNLDGSTGFVTDLVVEDIGI